MNRRKFLGTLLGLVAVPAIIANTLSNTNPHAAIQEPSAGTPAKVVNDWDEIREKEAYYRVVGYKGQQFYEPGIIYAPYIPLLVKDKIAVSPNRPDYTKYASKFKVYRDPNIEKRVEKSMEEAMERAIKDTIAEGRRNYWLRRFKGVFGLGVV